MASIFLQERRTDRKQASWVVKGDTRVTCHKSVNEINTLGNVSTPVGTIAGGDQEDLASGHILPNVPKGHWRDSHNSD